MPSSGWSAATGSSAPNALKIEDDKIHGDTYLIIVGTLGWKTSVFAAFLEN